MILQTFSRKSRRNPNSLYLKTLLLPSTNSRMGKRLKSNPLIPSSHSETLERMVMLLLVSRLLPKSSRQVTTRKISVEASCTKYLDAIAKRLAEFYEFDYRFKSGATIGDVLEAKDGVEGEDWDVRRAVNTHYQTDDDGFVVEIRKGQPLTKVKLPDVYTPDEWFKISQFNKKTTTRIHSAFLPSNSNGKLYIIIPHSEFTEEMVSFLKSIGVKANLFSSPDDLEVKDEDLL